ncbi:GNAT family N-acetyltransferase [Crocosphaera sp. Alani8]|uniref:GNAT family N-acetyltransferase n=1 Tax=Crocosphaera sp. Alani8 TaxID=3038952 RepID=UPI00313A8C47
MEIKVLSPEIDSSYLDLIGKLRVSVWSYQLGRAVFSGEKWCDEHDQHAFHWVVMNDENELIASARLSIHNNIADLPDFNEIQGLITELPKPIAMMSRLVVSPTYQRLGISQKIDLARLQKAKQMGIQSLVLQVPHYRRKSIEKLGFKCLGKAIDKTFKHSDNIDFFLYTKVMNDE